MAPVISTVQQLVNENSVNDFMTASEILIKFANNVLQNPSEQKYRRIRLANPTVEGKLLPVCGAMECLFEMGFAEVELDFSYNFKVCLNFCVHHDLPILAFCGCQVCVWYYLSNNDE